MAKKKTSIEIEDSKKDAIKFIHILKTADKGCSYCVSELLKLFIKEFPEHRELAERELKKLKNEI